MTTVTILNDCLQDIQDDPEAFVERVVEDMHREDGRSSAVQVARTGHADEFRLYAVHQNLMVELCPYSTRTSKLAEGPFGPASILGLIELARRNLDALEGRLVAQASLDARSAAEPPHNSKELA